MAKLSEQDGKRDPSRPGRRQRAPRRVPHKADHRISGTEAAESEGVVEIGGVRLTHPHRVLWQEQGLTKQQLAEFYLDIAGWVLPHVVGRPLSLVRCPSGAEKGCFFQKHPWAGLAEHVIRETLRDEKGEQEVLLVRDIRGLIALVQAGVLEIHPWGATFADIEHPDRVVFDFDPGDGVAWAQVVASARELRERLAITRIESFVKTTGGKGLHVVVPLAPGVGWAEVKAFARNLAEAMEADDPGRYLTRAAKAERRGRVFIDYLRNTRGSTAVAAYSTRARSGAPVSTPLTWDELSDATPSNHFGVENVRSRLRSLRADPWKEFDRLRQVLPKGARARAGR